MAAGSYQINEDGFWRIVNEEGDYMRTKGKILKSLTKFKNVQVFQFFGSRFPGSDPAI